MESLYLDFRLAFRSWRHRPLLTGVVVLTLGLGFAAPAIMVSVVDAVLLAPLPYFEPERLAVIRAALPRQRQAATQLSGPELEAVRDRASNIRIVGGVWARPGLIGPPESATQIEVGWVTRGFLETYGVSPQLGRLPSDREHLRSDVIVLSDALWRDQFGADGSIIGRTLMFDHEPRTVIAVMPATFRLLFPPIDAVPEAVQAWLPWGSDPADMARGFRVFTVVARIADNSSHLAVASELSSIAEFISRESVEYAQSGIELTANGLTNTIVAPVLKTLLILLAVVGLVFVIACANVANLLVLRSLERATEFATRLSLGASARRIWRQILTETMALGICGAAFGLGMGALGVGLLLRLNPAGIPRVQNVTIGQNTILTAILMTVIVALALGVIAGRYSLSNGQRRYQPSRGATSRVTPTQTVLVIAQLALSVILLTSAGLLIRTVVKLHSVDLGFQPANVVSMRISLPDIRYPYATGGEAIAEFYLRLDDRLQALPAVQAAGSTVSPPLADLPMRPKPYAFRMAEADVQWGALAADYRTVTPGWFPAVGARLVTGRFFDGRDRWNSPIAVVVDTTLAEKAWPRQRAVGQAIRVELFRGGVLTPTWGEVVGVVDSMRVDDLVTGQREQIYIAHAQSPQRTMYPAIRTDGSPAAVLPLVRSTVAALEPGLPVFDVRLASDHMNRAMAKTRFAMISLTIFGAVAVLLAAAGVFAAMFASVAQRRREIGVRMALGASPGRVFRTTLGEGLTVGLTGITIGLAGALATTRAISSLLFGVASNDAVTLIAVVALVVGLVAGACWLPATRAARIDPCRQLRAE